MVTRRHSRRILAAFILVLGSACDDSKFVTSDEFEGSTEASSALSAPVGTVPSSLEGNGFTSSWDGRLFIISQYDSSTQKVNWNACAFRPQNVGTTISGATQKLNFQVSGSAAISTCSTFLKQIDDYSFTASGQRSNLIDLNAIAMVPAGSPMTSPYKSTADGTASSTGTAATYDLRIYSQVYNLNSLRNPNLGGLPSLTMGVMRFRVIVINAGTATASVGTVSLVEDWQPLEAGGGLIHGLEPTVTADGNLLVYNSNSPDSLWYTYNAAPSNRSGWSPPKKISELYVETGRINGQTLQERYAVARKQIRSNLGEPYSPSDTLRGAYPWLSWEGADLFFTSTITYDNALRGSWSTFGESTGGQVRRIDGAFRESEPDTSLVLFTTAIATTSTMWSPFKQLASPSFPTVNERPVGLFFHSNGKSAAEVSFKAYFDGAYVTHLDMNRALSKITPSAGVGFDSARTPDTSGSNAYGELLAEARVPVYSYAEAATQNFFGEHVRFKAQSAVFVNISTAAVDTKNFSIELAVRPLVDLSANSANAYLFIANVPGVANLILEKNRQVQVSLFGGAGFRTGPIGPSLPLNAWSHLAATWNAKAERLIVTVDAKVVFDRRLVGFVVSPSSGGVHLGPSGWNSAFASSSNEVIGIDEFKLSRVTRSIDEIADSAFLPLGQRALPALTLNSAVPANRLRVMGQTFTQPVAQLGSLLFRDARLSSNNAVSCATCHDPTRFFTDAKAKSRGVTGTDLFVHTPTLVNRGMGRTQHWNGQWASNGMQAWAPLTTSNEMGLTVNEVITRLTNNPEYKARFQTVFAANPSTQNIETALGAFVNSILAGKSRFDRFNAGETTVLSADELVGRDLFFGKARCSACHNGPNFSDEGFHDTAFFPAGTVGRKEVSARSGDDRKIKTPTLRNVTKTAPYFHTGSVNTLGEVIDLYITGGGTSPDKASELKAVALTSTEKNQLIAFLGTLESDVTYAHAINLTETLPGLVPPAAPNLAYSKTTWSFTRGVAIAAITPTNSGGAIASCTSAPALPAGLTMGATSCAITGTPTVTKGATTYTVTATNVTGTSAKALNFTVLEPAPVISYSPTSLALTKGFAMAAKSVTNTGGIIASCTSSLTLPLGVSLSSACTVSGTPTILQSNVAYRITATNTGGTSSTTLTLSVNNPPLPPVISYSPSSLTLTKSVAMTAKTVTNTGGAIASCASSPTLPPGVALSATCTVSGTPTALAASTAFRITATNLGGAHATTLTLTVLDRAPVIAYPVTAKTFFKGTSISPLTITNTGGAITSCTSSPTLPPGLAIAATTCAITGTPTALKATTSYTITARNGGGTDTFVLNLTVVDSLTPNLVIDAGGLNLTGGQSVTASNLRLTYQGDGNLVVYTTAGSALWATGTAGRSCSSGCAAKFQTDGNLVLTQAGTAYWSSQTVGSKKLFVTEVAPFVVIRDSMNAIMWSGGALNYKPGEFLLSGGASSRGRDALVAFQTDGNLIVYTTAGATVWASNTGGRDCSTGCVAAFQTDGNLVLYKNGSPYWASSTVGSGATLSAQATSPGLFIRNSAGVVIW